MKEKPILFSGPMVRAILDGRKTMTRRIVKIPRHTPKEPTYPMFAAWEGQWQNGRVLCPYGQPGDRLWVRETWAPVPSGPCRPDNPVMYAATVEKPHIWTWKPSIHMPRWASRITLEVTGVRVERLQDISNADCWAEGMCDDNNPEQKLNRRWFSELWESINGPGSWEQNPWVWVVEFRRVEK